MSTNTNNSIDDDIEQPASAALVEPLLPVETKPEILADTEQGEAVATEPAVELASEPSQVRVENVSLDRELIIDESGWDHGAVQEVACRNWGVAIIFLAQLITVIVLAVMAIVAIARGDYHFPNDAPDVQALKLLGFFLVTIVATMVLSGTIIIILLGPLAEMMIQLSLVMSPISFALSAISALALGQIGVALFCLFFASIGVCYAVRVWHRIPFATANLSVALAALKANKGLLPMSYVTSLVATIWFMISALAFMQVFVLEPDWTLTCVDAHDDAGEPDCHVSTRGRWIFFGLLLSFYWSAQVIKNIFHTTVAGVVGTFWFAPNDATGSWCNAAVYDSWVRSTVYSFGSICLGSFLVAFVQILQFLVRSGREHRERRQQQPSLLFCLLQFLLDHLERLVEYINNWAFVYVGLYGYEYWTASYKVFQLFRARGWSLILNDFLVARSLAMMQLLVGILSGILAVVLALFAYGLSIHPVAAFFFGMILGSMLSNVQLQVVTSAVDTIVVCFAEAPSALVENHPPERSSRLIRAWRDAYPDEVGF